MGSKKGFPLAHITELSDEQKMQLRNQGITTAEEFVGHAWSVPEEFAESLGITSENLGFLTDAVSKYIDPEFWDEMLTLQKGMPKHKMGALDPSLFDSTICPFCRNVAHTREVCKRCGKADSFGLDTLMYCRKCAEDLGVCRGCGVPLRRPKTGCF